ncbi:helix-turn-helix domain-containing protein [Paenibacillus sp. LHD-38]|uniref:helix-turn-helix domain-containing protein n=1 Tax=Paenibacillus sp. LHD-38 TaxID=3072143 RepID=UPI00280F6943|nr:helix-turn-helix domain-containing protein [Paenibacillus sp. LHD-38]MDQ8733229.1 helix-turn-helix domain-containing protein [Paenibacillus sp. LHD-38]
MRQAVSDEQITAICRLMHNNFQVPAYYVNKDLELLASSHGGIALEGPLHKNFRESIEQLHIEEASAEYPLIQSRNGLENFVITQVRRGSDEQAGYVIVGPSTYTDISDENITGLINDYGVPAHLKESARKYYLSLPVISGLKLLHASVLLYFLLYGEELSTFDILQRGAALSEEEHPGFAQHIDRNLSSQREITALHHDVGLEKQLFQLIKEGRTEQLGEYARFEPSNLGILSKSSYLRSQKNIAVAGITLATRAAIEGGLHSEIAFTMSDLYIQHMEELTDIESVVKSRTEAMLAFAERVKHSRTGKYSRVVAECQQVIYSHIYEEVTVTKLAERMRLNANYLSQLFKQEVGMPIHSYIIQEKIEEAKKLLSASELTLSEIWARLNFYDQSHFTKTFKKLTGVTPKQFRSYPRE